MKKFKNILAFLLGTGLAFQVSLSAAAAELPAEIQTEEVQSEEGQEENKQTKEAESEDVSRGLKNGIDQSYLEEAKKALKEITDQDVVMALIYLTDVYNIKAAPGADAKTCMQASTGTTVQILGVDVDENSNIWYQVSVMNGESTVTGYVEREYLAYSNEAFIEWENNYFAKVMVLADKGGSYADVEQFPESYQAKLRQLKSEHPNWIFVKQDTGLKWSTVIKNENYEDRSLIPSGMADAYKGEYHSPGWYYASEAAIEYYMDPRNFLDETRIFQFEQLTFNSSYHSLSAVQNILSSTFMKGDVPGEGTSYASTFYNIGASLKVSPFHLACRVYQEQGKGDSAIISGTYAGYEGYYNYYNIGASGTTTKQVIESGLKRAVKEGWNSRCASLKGGAVILSKDYILKGQDTLYLQKFDVEGSSLYWHQYMQNIMAPYSEAKMVKTAYQSTGALDNPFVFKIPVYSSMPSAACPAPETVSTPAPTQTPTATPKPTATPTSKPTATPTPTVRPTATPTSKPTAAPTAKPTEKPVATAAPTVKPTATPTVKPTATPTSKPTAAPTAKPTEKPIATATPTNKPTAAPTAKPTEKPVATAKPTVKPTATPTSKPTATPTVKPTEKPVATATPTVKPTEKPVATATPTSKPTAKPTEKPVATAKPTVKPTATPTSKPTATPTVKPTEKPVATAAPTAEPTTKPAVTPKPTTAPSTSEDGSNDDNTNDQSGSETNDNTDNTAQQPDQEQQEQAAVMQTPESTQVPDVTQGTTSTGVVVAASTPKPQTAVDEKPVVFMDMSKSTMLYGETLSKMKAQNMEVILEMSDDITWTIDSSTIEEDAPANVDLKVTLGESTIPEEMLTALTENETYVELSLAHDGAFGFTAELTLKLEEARPGQYASLFYYNEEAQRFEFLCAAQVNRSNKAAFEFSHASDYVIIISDDTKEYLLTQKAESMEEAEEVLAVAAAVPAEIKPAKEPKKAAGTIVVIILACVAVVIGALLLFMKSDKDK